MTFAIITHVEHLNQGPEYWAYSAYVREMNIWLKHVDEVIVVGPKSSEPPSNIHLEYRHDSLSLKPIPKISLLGISEVIKSIVNLPVIFYQILTAMRKADHIHLRCPGNIGLLGCVAQIFFPKKPKTAKYAGNWDLNSKQPRSYRIQKWLLGNTFFTKNMTTLVYGDWPNTSKNIKPFFTASYYEHKTSLTQERTFESPFKAMYVGSLAPGKQPIYAIQLVEQLAKKGVSISLDIFGDGALAEEVSEYIEKKNLGSIVNWHGNQTAETVEAAYRESDLMLLPSKSEGWPKVVAEAMFWGCIPVVTPISCVPWMLDKGERGILISEELDEDVDKLSELLNNTERMAKMSSRGQSWSQNYTLNKFETEIVKLLK